MKFLAKSNPFESIQEHTDALLERYHKLRGVYPNLKVDWDILYYACLYHDLGKINRKFQDKLKKGLIDKKEIPHGIMSLYFIDKNKLFDENFSKDDLEVLANAIAYHHDRVMDYEKVDLEEQVDIMKSDALNFKYEKLENIRVKKLSARYFSRNRIYEEDDEIKFLKYVVIKGLLNRIDYAASAHIEIENENNFLIDSLEKNLLAAWKQRDKNSNWNELQHYMIENSEKNVVIVAQTGLGKTEAGLLWLGNNKGFFTLPMKTAINAMYKRISKDIIQNEFEKKIGLLHSDTIKEYLNLKENSIVNDLDIDEYYNKTRQLSLPITICTIDQIFNFVYKYRGFEHKLATLSYSKVIIDEVQMYSPDLLAYLVLGLSYLSKVGGKFAIMTATLPQVFVEELMKEGLVFQKPKPFTNKKIRHSLKVIEDKINSEFILDKYSENKVLVICNTVKEAQRLYLNISAELYRFDETELNLFHSGFIKKDRKLKEDKILEFGQRSNHEKGIWITTQVVEASLDIDFDILITELSDLNGLFQRMGRCYRSRDWDKDGHNCYVFNGGEGKCTGVGSVIDKDIFNLSKKQLRQKEGIILESEKIQMIESMYTTEQIKETEYYKKFLSIKKYVKSIEIYEKSKKDIDKIFRNIKSIEVIPRSVYESHREEIESSIEVINKKYDKNLEKASVDKLKAEKLKSRLTIDDFTVTIPVYSKRDDFIEVLEINRHEKRYIYECEYDSEMGIRHLELNKESEIEKGSSELDNFF